MALEINEKEVAAASSFELWKETEAGKEKIGKLKSSIVSRGVSEETAESKAEETYKRRVLSKAVEAVQEKFEEEKKAIEEEIREKQAALETMGK
ncbi:uncharacterized protein [Blastocystis hominis]|uniref:Uncharacterized protein n=1 Tax=Blastocystis hominis TaxID=12968 RepID=D8LXI7_BLAHO|nr:uncharacterized protein [Blastocystis hominis]CBK20982.2 unnamed protein product [Blastocystis hominis]|eukprot:XP_012895030.1 uncharacterized protein [Blastocystis hominis]